MRAKEYLQQVQRLNLMVNQKIKELEDLREMADGIKGIDYSKDHIHSNSFSESQLENLILSMTELEQKINAEIDRFVDIKDTVIDNIQMLRNHRHIDILYKHYVEFKRLEVVAVDMNYTYQYVVELHGSALKEFQQTHKNLLKTYDGKC